jgi:hypothetical protein
MANKNDSGMGILHLRNNINKHKQDSQNYLHQLAEGTRVPQQKCKIIIFIENIPTVVHIPTIVVLLIVANSYQPQN